MNFHLLQTPCRVKAFSNTRYIYKPSVVSESMSLKPGATVCVVGVTEGKDAGSTAVKVMTSSIFLSHVEKGKYGASECSRLDAEKYDDVCECELPIEKMSALRDSTFIVLLADLGR